MSWSDPRLPAVIDKTQLIDLPDWSRQHGFPAEVEITTVDQQVYRRRVEFPKRHERHPMTDEDVQAKFRNAGSRLMEQAQMRWVIRGIEHLDASRDIGDLSRTLTLVPR